MGEAPESLSEPRYAAFRVAYPSGTVLESCWLIEGGGTVQQVRLEHPLAVVEPVEDSMVHVGDGL